MPSNNVNNKFDAFAMKTYKLFYLKDFCIKTSFEKVFSWTYNIIFMIAGLIGFIPIIESMISGAGTSSFDYDIYVFSLFIISFVFLFDMIIRVICCKFYYDATKYRGGLKCLSRSIFAYIELATWLSTFIVVLTLGKFEHGEIILESHDNKAVTVTTTILFLSNTFAGYKRFFLYSHNKGDVDIFSDLIKQKRKFWLTSILIVVFIILIFSFSIYVFESSYTGDSTNTNLQRIKSIWDALYFSLVTVSTVGFGVVMPIAPESRAFVVILMITGIYMYAFLSSQFINVFNEFFAKKKEMSEKAAADKAKEVEQEYLLQRIDELILDNMYKAKVINKKTYSKLLKEKQKEDTVFNNSFKETDFSFDDNTKTIYFCGTPLGNYIEDHEIVQKAFDSNWSVATKQDLKYTKPTAALYFLTSKVANDLAHNRDKIQIIFTSKQIDKRLSKLIIYQKKPFISSICELDIAATLVKEKSQMWKKFGKYTNLTEDKFTNLFKRQKNVTAIFVKNIILYDKPKQIESYGISNILKMKEILPLV